MPTFTDAITQQLYAQLVEEATANESVLLFGGGAGAAYRQEIKGHGYWSTDEDFARSTGISIAVPLNAGTPDRSIADGRGLESGGGGLATGRSRGWQQYAIAYANRVLIGDAP